MHWIIWRLRVKHPYYNKNKNIYWFGIGVVGVLQGGLHDSTELFLNAKVGENDILSNFYVEVKGYHTIVDIISKYDRCNENSLYYSEFYEHYLGNADKEAAIRNSLLSDIKKQIIKIDKYWQIVCDYYPKL